MIAVFSCEDSSTHTCWKACFKSTLLKTVHPTSRSLNEDNVGNGYLSSCVTVHPACSSCVSSSPVMTTCQSTTDYNSSVRACSAIFSTVARYQLLCNVNQC